MIKYPVALLRDAATEDRLDSLQVDLLHCDPLVNIQVEAFCSFNHWQASDTPYLLAVQQDALTLIPKDRKLHPLQVDFISGTLGFRGHQNVRNEMVVKAVLGRDKQHLPTVTDATAGMGRDSFLLAVLGCQVTLMERNPFVLLLLADGLYRFRKKGDADIAARMVLQPGNFATDFTKLTPTEVVYLDPMFPKREKSALVKKEMQIFKDVVGPDADSDQLLAAALQVAQKKIVVKRSSKADYLAQAKPTYSLSGRSSRFDVYQTH